MNYDVFCGILADEKLELLFRYCNVQYWIIVNDKFRFLSDGIEPRLYSTASDLLNARLIGSKRLKDIWPCIEILSFDYGWTKTED